MFNPGAPDWSYTSARPFKLSLLSALVLISLDASAAFLPNSGGQGSMETFMATDAIDPSLTDSETINITVTADSETVATPTATPARGTFTDSVSVSLATDTIKATIYDTLDGSQTTASSPLYTGPFTLTQSATVKAIATHWGYTDSAVANAKFTIVAASQSVPRYGVFEQTLQHTGSYTNPYTDVSATATLNGPGGAQKSTPLYWDGGTTWKLRFSPNAIGTWTWTISSNDPGLDSQSGSFDCQNSANKGGIRRDRAHPYHFEYENGRPVWWFGETQWHLFSDEPKEGLGRAAALHFIDVRAQQGFNYIQSELFTFKAQNRGAPTFNNISAEVLNVDFFKEVDHRLRYLNSKGITSGLFLSWATGWDFLPSDAARLRYARYVVARYSAYNVIFVVSGEWQSTGVDKKPRYVAIGNEIKDADPHDRLISIHPGSQYASVEEFNSTGWMSFGDFQQNYDSLHGEILDSRDHNKPVVNAEYGYYLRDKNGDGIVDKPNSRTREQFRNAAYDILMASGHIVTGFGTTYFGGGRDPGPFNVGDPKNDAAEGDLINMRRLFTSTRWWLLQPSDALLIGPGTHYALAEIGEQYLAYTRGTSSALLISLGGAPAATYEIKCFDPRAGVWSVLPGYTGAGSIELVPPDQQDWVFYIKKRN